MPGPALAAAARRCYHQNVTPLAALAALLADRPAVALVGAGLSTDSGIPDYRGAGRPPRRPILHADFVRSARARARYWARSLVGWPRLAAARPNRGHLALADLEEQGAVRGVLTQNVDGLHHAAGSRRVIELHGALARVRCLACGAPCPRTTVQERMRRDNPDVALADAASAPDGDADLAEALLDRFVPPACLPCGGPLKPDVVLFGDNVRREVLDAAWALLGESRSLLVLGSSLAVWSGLRFVKRAVENDLPVAIVNLGPTRGDAWARVRLDAPLGDVLPTLAATLRG
jgi:NAD-dependent SIR2 family protein deacetylase